MPNVPTTVFLDRDGVINRKMPEGDYVERWDQFEFLPGAIEALRLLRSAGIRTVVVTNQRGIALGRMTAEDVDKIHRRLQARLALDGAECDAILVCPHDVASCDCRKPAVGLFRQAQARFPEIDLARAVVIGDSASDLLAGHRLGCRSCFVGDEHRLAAVRATYPELAAPDAIAGSAATLLEVVRSLLG
jgi:D-glycero-D-manno-heptose 1,7-bisphosphate phosphatase